MNLSTNKCTVPHQKEIENKLQICAELKLEKPPPRQ